MRERLLEIRLIIATEIGWTQLLARLKGSTQSVLETLIKDDCPLTIGTHILTVEQMQKLSDTTLSLAYKLSMFPPRKEFFDLIPTLDIANKAGILWE